MAKLATHWDSSDICNEWDNNGDKMLVFNQSSFSDAAKIAWRVRGGEVIGMIRFFEPTHSRLR